MTAQLHANAWGMTFHHFGLAVRERAPAAAFLTGLGYAAGPVVFDPLQNVDLGMWTQAAAPDVEVISPAEGAGPLDKLLAGHREGLVYHLCYASADLDGALEAIEAEGLRLFEISPPKPAVLFGGKFVTFYLVGGVGLIEIIDEGRPSGG